MTGRWPTLCTYMRGTVLALLVTILAATFTELPSWLTWAWAVTAVAWAFTAHNQWDRRVDPEKWAKFSQEWEEGPQ